MPSSRLYIGRDSAPGAWYVLTTVTDRRQPLFASERLAACVATEIALLDPNQALTHAWVLMPDHLHWLLELGPSGSLAAVARRIKSRSAIAVNRVRALNMRVWQAGYFDHRVRREEDLFAQARYLVENPVRAGLVGRIEDYPHWSCRWISRTEDLD